MKILVSLVLTIFIYIGLVLGGYFALIQKKNTQKPKVVYVHTAISSKTQKKEKLEKHILKNTTTKKVSKSVKTKDELSTGGDDIKFDDIFSNISDNVTTSKIKHKKHQQMTKHIGNTNIKEVKKQLSKLNFTSKLSNTKGSKVDLSYIQNEFSKVWSLIDTNAGDFVRVQVNIYSGKINIIIIATNLDTIRLNQFLTDLKSIDTSKIKKLKAIIDFKSKLKE